MSYTEVFIKRSAYNNAAVAYYRFCKVGKNSARSALVANILIFAVCRNSRKFSCTLLNCFIGQALMHAPQPMHADSSTFAYTNPSLSGFILIALTGHLSAHAEQPQQSCLSYSFICFSWAGKIPSSAAEMYSAE